MRLQIAMLMVLACLCVATAGAQKAPKEGAVAICCCVQSPQKAKAYAEQMAKAVPGLTYTLENTPENGECPGVTIWIAHPQKDGDALCEAVFQSLHTEVPCSKE